MSGVSLRARALLLVTAVAGLMAFLWPLFLDPTWDLDATLAPLVFALVLPMVLAVVVSELTSNAMDVKGLALLGVLAAVGAVLRPLGTGTVGMEPIFFILIIGGRVFGPGFGFAQGAITMFASALLTGGVGAWLPYQMVAAGFVGLVAGLLPKASGRRELALLAAYGFMASFAYGWLMDFAFWPFGIGPATQFSFDPDAGTLANLHTFVLYNIATSMGWNLGRALTTIALLLILAPGILRVLRRAARRASFAPGGGMNR